MDFDNLSWMDDAGAVLPKITDIAKDEPPHSINWTYLLTYLYDRRHC